MPELVISGRLDLMT